MRSLRFCSEFHTETEKIPHSASLHRVFIMLLWILTIILVIWIAEEFINNWNNDPLGNRTQYYRPKHTQFMTYYGLSKQMPISEFELKMAAGMFCEGKEICVTAFCKSGMVERVSVTIGKSSYCSSSNDIAEWLCHAKKLRCDEIRLYHNHPNAILRKYASPTDLDMHKKIKSFFEGKNIPLRSFLIYANFFKGWQIKEYGKPL